MSKKLFKRLMPDAKKIQSHKALKIFGNTLYNPNLWHFNRYSVATAFSIGLFCAWLPSPGHMLASAAVAILFHDNLPLAPIPFQIELSWDWLGTQLLLVWKPLLLGSLLCGLFCAILSNLLIRLSWRWSVSKQWRARKATRAKLSK